MIQCKIEGDGVLVPVSAQPGASRDRIVGEYNGALKIAVTQPPERGRANDAIAALLAEALGVRASAVALVSGETTRNKMFKVRGITTEQLNRLV